MKRVIDVYIVKTTRRGSANVPVSTVRGAKWTQRAHHVLFGHLTPFPKQLPAEEVAQAAAEALRCFYCTAGFIPDPEAPEGILEGGKYVSAVEVEPGTGHRRQQEAFLDGFTSEELALIHAKMFGG